MNNSQYTLSYLPQFYVDFSNAVLYIKNELQNPTAAKKLVGEVKKAIEKRLPNCEAFEPYISKHERRYKYYRIYLRSYKYTMLLSMMIRAVKRKWKYDVFLVIDKMSVK